MPEEQLFFNPFNSSYKVKEADSINEKNRLLKNLEKIKQNMDDPKLEKTLGYSTLKQSITEDMDNLVARNRLDHIE